MPNSHRRIIFLAALLMVMAAFPPAPSARAETLGQQHTFYTNVTYDASARSSISATLEYVSAKGYFYVDDSYLSTLGPSQRATIDQLITNLANEWDNNIYPSE